MKNIKHALLAMGLLLGMNVTGQSKDICLYSTDFTDWGAIDNTSGSSSDQIAATQGGAGFYVTDKCTVSPTGNVGGYTGYVTASGSSWMFITKPFDFISGGIVELELYGTGGGSNRTISVSGGTVSKVSLEETTFSDASNYKNVLIGSTPLGDKAGITYTMGNWENGSTFTARSSAFYHRVLFYLPSLTGEKALTLTGMNKDFSIVGMKVYTCVGTTPYVCSPTYPNAKADGSGATSGLKLQGETGSAAVSGTVDVKGYNLTGDVTLSVVGDDAAKFTLGTTTMSAAEAMAGGNVTVNFTPSVKVGNAVALLKMSSANNDYYVNLTGVSGSSNPQIVANPTSTLNFMTYQLGTFIQEVDVTGLNLTGPITASVDNAMYFAVSSPTISLYDATKGTKLKITFTGDIEESTQNGILTLSADGAQSVQIPLVGVTTLVKPTMYKVEFSVSPSGSGYVETEPGGTSFVEGSKVVVKVTPETGYSIASWSDNAGTKKASRTFTISAATPQQIVCNLTKGGSGGGGGGTTTTSGFVGLKAENITETSMTACWSVATASDATAGVTYTVTLKDVSGNTVATQSGLTTTSYDFTGLTAATGYKYEVTTTGAVTGQTTTGEVGPFYTSDTTVIECGDDNYVK